MNENYAIVAVVVLTLVGLVLLVKTMQSQSDNGSEANKNDDLPKTNEVLESVAKAEPEPVAPEPQTKKSVVKKTATKKTARKSRRGRKPKAQ